MFHRIFHRSALLRKLIPFKLADIGEGITEVQILQWYVKEGSPIKQFERIAEVQSDKATVEITSRYDGIVKKLHYAALDTAEVGEPLVDIETGEAEVPVEQPVQQKQSEKQPEPLDIPADSSTLAMPSVRRAAKERGIDLSSVKGSGKGGRIMLEDLEQSKPEPPTKASQSSHLTYRPVTLNPVKKAMIKAMEASLTVPHFNYCDEYRLDSLLRARKQFIEGTGLKISILPFVLKAISMAATDFPLINAHYFPERKELMTVHEHNIAIAVDSPLGLTVPVLRGVQNKSVQEIAIDLQALTERARDNSLRQEDFADGTLSFSNIGSIGGTYASPLIVPPQVAIGALGRTRAQVIPVGPDSLTTQVCQLAPISWAADHRVIDGATMAKFSNRVKELLESPLLLVLQ